jgi:hypothetical protein
MENDALGGVHVCTLRGGVYRGPPPLCDPLLVVPAPEGEGGQVSPTSGMHTRTPHLD